MIQQLEISGSPLAHYLRIKALAAHHLSHFLWRRGFKLLARMHSQFGAFGLR